MVRNGRRQWWAKSSPTSKPDANVKCIVFVSNLNCLIGLRKNVGNDFDFIINLQIKINYHRHWWMWVIHDIRNREPIFLSLICLSCETWIANTCFFSVCLWGWAACWWYKMEWHHSSLKCSRPIDMQSFFSPVSKWQQ